MFPLQMASWVYSYGPTNSYLYDLEIMIYNL